MTTIRVNMDARSKGGAPVPDGDYLCEVVQILEGESSQKHSPQLNITLRVAEGAHAEGKLLDFIPLSEKSAFRSADFFYACGVDEPGENDIEIESYAKLDAEGNEMQEQGAMIMVKKVTEDDEYNGQKRKRQRLFYSRAAGTEEAPAEEAEAEEAPASKSVAPKPALKKATVAVAPAKPARKITLKA